MKLLALLLLCLPAYGQDMLAHIDRTNGTSEWHHVSKTGAKITDLGKTEPKSFVGSIRPRASGLTVNGVTTRTSTVAVVPMTCSNGAGQQLASADIASMWSQVSALYAEQSYGKQTLNVTVTPLLDSGQPCGGCPWDQLMGTAGAAYTNSYDYVFVVGPYDGSCGFLGVAFVGWPLALSNGQNRLSTYAHELGHNFGLLHAGNQRHICSRVWRRLQFNGQSVWVALQRRAESDPRVDHAGSDSNAGG